jgi:hypothetical protein
MAAFAKKGGDDDQHTHVQTLQMQQRAARRQADAVQGQQAKELERVDGDQGGAHRPGHQRQGDHPQAQAVLYGRLVCCCFVVVGAAAAAAREAVLRV